MAEPQKPTETDTKTHLSGIVFRNVALPLKWPGERPPQLRRKRPDTHEPEYKLRGQKLFDLEQAQCVIEERARRSPLHGFTHIDQLGTFLDPKVFERVQWRT